MHIAFGVMQLMRLTTIASLLQVSIQILKHFVNKVITTKLFVTDTMHTVVGEMNVVQV